MIKFLDLQRLNASFQPELSDAIRRVVDAGWYLRGTETNHFEAEFAEFCQQKYCIGVATGCSDTRPTGKEDACRMGG